MQSHSLEEKIRLYCDLNDIAHPEIYQAVIPFLDDASLQHCQAWNTNDFLIYGLRDLAHGLIDDETFFQIGDITSTRPLKQSRPHLDAVEVLMKATQMNTLYVIDVAAREAYEEVHGPWSEVEKKLKEESSVVVAL